MIDQDAPHGLRGDAEEMRAILPADCPLIDELYEGFVDERRRLQCVVTSLASEVAGGQPLQFGVDLRQESVECVFAPVAPQLQKRGDLGT